MFTLFYKGVAMKKYRAFNALCAAAVVFCGCARINYEEVRTPMSTVKKEKSIQFQIDSQPQGAGTYVDGVAVGPTPVTVQTTYQCNEVTYKAEKVLKARRTGLDIGAGAGMLSGALVLGLAAGFGAQNTESQIAAGVLAAGLAVPGLALFIRGLVLKKKHGKVQSSQVKTIEECPPKFWKLVLTNYNYLPAERILKVKDSGKVNFVALSPATIISSGAPPPAAVDKGTLLSSMAAKTDVLSGNDPSVSKDSKKAVKERMKTLTSHISVGEGYEVAGDDLYLSMEANDIKMFEMTTEKNYCYIISAVAQLGNPLFMAVFRNNKEIVKDFKGSDIASVRFCSDSSDPVRVTTSSLNQTAIGLRIHYLAR